MTSLFDFGLPTHPKNARSDFWTCSDSLFWRLVKGGEGPG